LTDEGLLVAMEELDGVLDRDDVDGAALVDGAENRRQRCRLAAAGHPRHQDQPSGGARQLVENRRQLEIAQRWDLEGDRAKREAERPPLRKKVDANPSQPLHTDREADLPRVGELLPHRGGQYLIRATPRLIGLEERQFQLAEDAKYPENGPSPD